MTILFRFLIILLTVFASAGCAKKHHGANSPIGVSPSEIYYSQVSLQFEKGRHLTTNYRRGTLLPINTQVMLNEISGKTIELEIMPSHAKLRIENVEKHTGDSPEQAFAKLFGKNKVDLSKFSKLEQDNILAGKVVKGMSRKAVIAALGYPPITETPVLTGNQWTYWASRFDRFVVNFDNDKVIKIQD